MAYAYEDKSYRGGYTVAIIIIALCIIDSLYFGIVTVLKMIDRSSRRENSNQQFATNTMLILTLICVISYVISVISAIFEPIYAYADRSKYRSEIDTSAALSVIFYSVGKFGSYLFFTYRLNYVFRDFTVSFHKSVNVCLYTLLSIQLLSLFLWNYGAISNEVAPDANDVDNVLNAGFGAIFFLIDIILGIMLPALFIRQLNKLIPQDMKMQHEKQLELNVNANTNTNANHAHQQSTISVSGGDAAVAATSDNNPRPTVTGNNVGSSSPADYENTERESDKEASSKRIPSIAAIGATTANMSLTKESGYNSGDSYNVNSSNDYKYQQILSTSARIALLATCTGIDLFVTFKPKCFVQNKKTLFRRFHHFLYNICINSIKYIIR
jgi:hypothetical protein